VSQHLVGNPEDFTPTKNQLQESTEKRKGKLGAAQRLVESRAYIFSPHFFFEGWMDLAYLSHGEKDCPPPVFPVFPRMGLGSDGTLTGGAAVAAHACCSDRHTEGGGFSTGVLPSRQ